MIKTKNGKIVMKGKICDIQADIAIIVKGAKKNFIAVGMTKETAEEAVKFAVELGLSDEGILEKMTGDTIGE